MPQLTRRRFVAAAAATGALPAGCSAAQSDYGRAVTNTWRPFGAGALTERDALPRELIRFATLAPSSHNTQCWKFGLEKNRISIFPDFERRCPAVDPDDHHLFVSLGCATENLVLAAQANGLHGEVRFDPVAAAVRIDLQPAKATPSARFAAIPSRQCSRAAYDGTMLDAGQLRRLEAAANGDGVGVLLLTARRSMDAVADDVIAGNTVQMSDAAFMNELRAWIRFSDGEAARKRDGLFSRASGNPSVPRWLASPLFGLLFTPASENAKYRAFIGSSAGVAVFVAETSDRAHWVDVGRAYQRFALEATALGVRTAMINQPVEVTALRPQFARSLGLGDRRPDLVVRFGHGPELPRSLRRPVSAVILT